MSRINFRCFRSAQSSGGDFGIPSQRTSNLFGLTWPKVTKYYLAQTNLTLSCQARHKLTMATLTYIKCEQATIPIQAFKHTGLLELKADPKDGQS